MTITRKPLPAILPLALLLSLSATDSQAAALSPGISGAWFNPEQSGHGLSIEVLSPTQALTFWYIYDSDGNPLILYIDGTISGRRIEGKAYAPQGMRFGSFDPAQLEMPEWGDLSIEFDSCESGTLRWNSPLAEFGSGETALRRLSGIAGLDCTMLDPDSSVKGLYTVSVDAGAGAPSNGIAAVDGYGQLWAIDFGGWPDTSPGPGWVSSGRPCIARGTVKTDESERSTLLETTNSWQLPQALWECDQRGWEGPLRTIDNGFELDSSTAADANTWRFAQRGDASLVAPVTLADLQGSRNTLLRWQFGELTSALTVSATGEICLDHHAAVGGPVFACTYRGQLTIDEEDPGFVDVRIGPPGAPAYEGRGWLEDTAAGRRLVLVTSNSTGGMGLVAK